MELAALLLEVKPGDEVIVPSFTFVSTANAFVLRGAKIVFVDVDPATMNMDPACVEAAVTPKTKVIAPVHYAGVCCDMDALNAIAAAHHLKVMEDAAQAVGSTYRGRAAGSLSDVGCYSFHETKNFSMGEGGATVLNHPELVERAEIIREKGTDRSRFYRGQVDKYTWVDIGSSFLPSELNAAYLLAQLEQRDKITARRMARWTEYDQGLRDLEEQGRLERMRVPEECGHNAHMYYIKLRDQEERGRADPFPEGTGNQRRVPLHPPAQRQGGPGVRCFRRRRPLYHPGQRAASAPSPVLRNDRRGKRQGDRVRA